MHQPAIARLEAGDHEPSLTTLARLARGLGVESAGMKRVEYGINDVLRIGQGVGRQERNQLSPAMSARLTHVPRNRERTAAVLVQGAPVHHPDDRSWPQFEVGGTGDEAGEPLCDGHVGFDRGGVPAVSTSTTSTGRVPVSSRAAHSARSARCGSAPAEPRGYAPNADAATCTCSAT